MLDHTDKYESDKTMQFLDSKEVIRYFSAPKKNHGRMDQQNQQSTPS